MGISGNYLPFHPKPLPDELLSSWLVRIARANSIVLHTFCDIHWRKKQIWNRDIDKSASEDIISVLSIKTGTPYETAYKTTLKSYESFLCEQINSKGHSMWIMPLGVYHRIHRLYGLQCCPQCLSEDKNPYFRKKWRLAFVTACSKHDCLLIDRCPECGVPINFHRIRVDDDSLTYCFKCRTDLRTAPTNKIQSSYLSEYQIFLCDTLEKGYAAIGDQPWVFSTLFFCVLHQIMHLMATCKQAKKLREYVFRQIATEEMIHIPERQYAISLEFLGIDERAHLTVLACWLLLSWPGRFIKACNELNLLSSILLRDMSSPPFWFWTIIHDFFYKDSYSPSDEEIQSAVNILRKQNNRIGSRAISKILGINDVFRKRNKKYEYYLDNDPK